MSIADFLKEQVYPRLDAVEAGLLDGLHPNTISASGSYKLECPKCGKKEGFYYPTRGYLQCNRKIECRQSTSIWDAIAHTRHDLQNKDILALLCSKAGVDLPNNKQAKGGDNGPTKRPAITPGKAIFQVTQHLATQNSQLLADFQADRGYSAEDLAQMKLGVYTSPEEVLKHLESLGITKETAVEKGYLQADDNDPTRLYSGMAGRVVGYWPHPDGDVRLWGRIPQGKGTKTNPKYRFARTLDKDIPYLFSKRRGMMPIFVEGTMDAWALQLLEQWGASIGQASINSAQALYLASQGIHEAAHMIDGDKAGFEGALSSIRNCEKIGITLSIIALGEGMDDADAMRRAGNGDALLKLISDRINAGEYLARFCAAQLAKNNVDLRMISRIRAIALDLTPASARRWEDMSRSLGIYENPKEQAVRLLAAYVSAGLPFEDGLYQVQKRTGLKISFEQDAVHG